MIEIRFFLRKGKNYREMQENTKNCIKKFPQNKNNHRRLFGCKIEMEFLPPPPPLIWKMGMKFSICWKKQKYVIGTLEIILLKNKYK